MAPTSQDTLLCREFREKRRLALAAENSEELAAFSGLNTLLGILYLQIKEWTKKFLHLISRNLERRPWLIDRKRKKKTH